MSEQTECIGVALEARKVEPLRFGETASQTQAGTFAEKGADGFLARVAEGRIAQIVRQTRCGHYIAQMVEMLGDMISVGVFLTQGKSYVVGH